MKIELSREDVKVAVMGYLKTTLGIDACAEDITLDGYSVSTAAQWEKKEDITDGE